MALCPAPAAFLVVATPAAGMSTIHLFGPVAEVLPSRSYAAGWLAFMGVYTYFLVPETKVNQRCADTLIAGLSHESATQLRAAPHHARCVVNVAACSTAVFLLRAGSLPSCAGSRWYQVHMQLHASQVSPVTKSLLAWHTSTLMFHHSQHLPPPSHTPSCAAITSKLLK